MQHQRNVESFLESDFPKALEALYARQKQLGDTIVSLEREVGVHQKEDPKKLEKSRDNIKNILVQALSSCASDLYCLAEGINTVVDIQAQQVDILMTESQCLQEELHLEQSVDNWKRLSDLKET